MQLVDAHLDLAMNALVLNRDLTKRAHDTRADEAGMTEKGRAAGTVGLPDLRQAEIGLCLATVLARVNPEGTSPLDFRTHEIAHAHAQGELALYRELERQGRMRMVTSREGLTRHVEMLSGLPGGPLPDDTPLGYVLLMEGADPIVAPDRVEGWWRDGLRVVGLAHYGSSAYAFGTDSAGPLTEKGRALVAEMDRLGMILDASHLTDESFHDALDRFHGPVLSSHSNCRALVPGDRQLDDEMIKRLAERGAVIGAVCDAWMLEPGWVRGESTPENVTVANVVDHIDHVCQVTGTSRHAAIGSDLDGGYGTEQTPKDLDTIADLQQIPELLIARDYSDDDIAGIMHGNWIRFLGDHLPSEPQA
ncbi:MAG TPA: membrane dipeptidase [Thermomicrobiales bacterium]|nr:membrane dipeptidase [Thermomicrobiales bacterium]